MLGRRASSSRISAQGSAGHGMEADQKQATAGSHPSDLKGLRHFKSSYKQALKRYISLASYTPERSGHRADSRGLPLPLVQTTCRARKLNAVVIYMMDVSGSMGDEQKEIVRHESRSGSIRGCARSTTTSTSRYIIHDASARKEVDQDTFYQHARKQAARLISAPRTSCVNEMIEKEYPTSEWNIYRAPLLRRRQLVVARTRSLCVEAASRGFCFTNVQHVLLRPGREQATAAGSSSRTSIGSSRAAARRFQVKTRAAALRPTSSSPAVSKVKR